MNFSMAVIAMYVLLDRDLLMNLKVHSIHAKCFVSLDLCLIVKAHLSRIVLLEDTLIKNFNLAYLVQKDITVIRLIEIWNAYRVPLGALTQLKVHLTALTAALDIILQIKEALVALHAILGHFLDQMQRSANGAL
jgi:hypothetical protein